MRIQMQRSVGRLAAVIGLVALHAVGAPNFMIAYCDGSWATDLKAKLAGTGLMNATDISLFDCAAATPTLAQLQANRGVVVFGNGNPLSAASLGDNLASYVDSGGVVVNMVFGYASNYIAGRWATGVYSGFPDMGYLGLSKTSDNLGTINNPGVWPADRLFLGVKTLTMGNYNGNGSLFIHNFTSTTAGSQLVGSWASGKELTALNATHLPGYVVSLNLVVPSSDARPDFGWWASTDGARLVANSLLFLPEPASLTVLAAGASLLSLRRKRA